MNLAWEVAPHVWKTPPLIITKECDRELQEFFIIATYLSLFDLTSAKLFDLFTFMVGNFRFNNWIIEATSEFISFHVVSWFSESDENGGFRCLMWYMPNKSNVSLFFISFKCFHWYNWCESNAFAIFKVRWR